MKIRQMTAEEIHRHYAEGEHDRRQFLKTAAVGVAAVPLAASAAAAGDSPAAGDAGRTVRSGATSVVAHAFHSGAVEEGRPITRKMIEGCLMALTGKRTAREAYLEFVSPKDVVGLKLNGLGGPNISNNPEVTDMVVAGLVDAGVPERNIILWDNRADFVRNCGYDLSETGSPRVWCGNDAGYSDVIEFESGRTRLTKIVTEHITALICLPILKDHVMAGVTLSLKSLSHGATNNPRDFHRNNCDPYIAEVCALPAIRNKWRLSILDGLKGVWDGGPGFSPSKSWYPLGIWASTDPVALDTIGAEVIEAKRAEVGARSLSRAGRPPKHLQTAQRIGLGVNDRERIDVVEARVV
jgi:uncharacterized protein (DUF362 family)